jgi:phosphocarrier protein
MSDPITREFIVSNRLGLHARAAATLVKVASRFQSEVMIIKGTQSVNGKSILGMMTLAASKGTPIAVTCDGSDQDAAMEAVAEAIEQGFWED